MVKGDYCETEKGFERFLLSGDGRKDFDTDVINELNETIYLI